jgi:hypothetical protein
LAHLWPTGSSLGWPPRLRPGTSPQTLQIPPRGGHPVLRLSHGQNTNLGTSPWQYPSFPISCPFRVLLIRVPRPARRYSRLWIWRPSSERQRDFNPPNPDAAQHTLQACPSTQTAEPAPHGVLVESHDLSPLGLPVFRDISLYRHAIATTPAEPWRSCRSISPRRRPSPRSSWVGFRGAFFEACSAFTRVTACLLAASPKSDSFHRRLRRLRYLHRRSDCYRLERQLPGGNRTR